MPAIDWNDNTPLTKAEFDQFLAPVIPKVVDLEIKFWWDFVVNDCTLQEFCRTIFALAFEYNDYKDYQEHFRKVQDVLTIGKILNEADWSVETEQIRKKEKFIIYNVLFNKINEVANALLS